MLKRRSSGIPVVAIVDTNCDPDEDRLRHPRQRRRDSRRKADLLLLMADAIMEGRQGNAEEAAVEEKEEAEAAEEAAK